MENIFIIAAIISVIFFIAKFIEMRFLDKDPKPLKLLVRDSLLVYLIFQYSRILRDVEDFTLGAVGIPLQSDC